MEYNLFVPIFEQITIKTVSTEKVKISTWDEGLQLLNGFLEPNQVVMAKHYNCFKVSEACSIHGQKTSS